MNFEQNSISRRALVSKFGGGIAGAALTAAVPTEGQAQTTAVPVVDPTTKYPRPPYPGQFQPWPGLPAR